MKIEIINARRADPMKGNGWGARLSKIDAEGTVRLSDNTPNAPFTKPESAGYREIKRDDFNKRVQKGGGFWVKTATFHGKARFYEAV